MKNYYYNDNGQKQEYVLRIPDYSIENHMIYYYSDTLLTQIISIKNSDTLRIERFDYNEIGLKKNIEIIDNKLDIVSKIIIEYEY